MSCHVLVIDDDDEIRDSVADALIASGYRVTRLPDASGAADVLQRNPEVAVIVTDVWMPGQTGIQLLKSLERRDGPSPAVVLMTGGWRPVPIETTAAIGGLHGAVTTLVKPFSLMDLRTAVAAAAARGSGGSTTT